MTEFDQLVLLSGINKGKIIPVKGVVTIGRHPDNTVQFDDLQVSRHHAQVFRRSDGVRIKDLGSGNGLFVGGLRVDEHLLSDNDIIRVGKQQLQFRSALGGTLESDSDAAGLVLKENTGNTFAAENAEKVYRTFFETPKDAISSMELREIQQRLRAVYAANQAIASERSLDKVFDTIMGQVFSLVHAHNGVILLAREDSGILNPEFVRSAVPGTKIQVSTSIVKRCYENGEAVITSDAPQDARFGGGMSIITENISSAMCVPLTHRGERLGAIYVANHGESGAFKNNDLELLVALASPAATAIRNAQYLATVEQTYRDTLVALANAIELRDHYTVGHTWRVTNFAMAIAREMGWDEKKIEEVQMGGVLHDIGKIAVDNAVLAKTSDLSESEFAQMKIHPERGADLLRDVKFLHPLIPYCLFHHERWDGDGYPFGLKDTDIPIEGRLIAVADAFDAMTSTRPYREGMNPDAALREILHGKNKQFDPMIVDALERCYRGGRIDEVLQDYYRKEARSIACPFCSTFIRFDETIGSGSQIQCSVCHKTVSIIQKDDAFFGMLAIRQADDTVSAPGYQI